MEMNNSAAASGQNLRVFRALALTTLATAIFCIPLTATAQPVPQTQVSSPEQAATLHYVPIKSIDFSSRHDVMIRNQDGSLTPMDAPYYTSKMIAPGVWQIESDGDFQYLIEGDNQALAIDSGYGAGNIREYMQTLTKKPIRYIANTHYHFDHTANDAYFDAAYMSAETAEKATVPYPSFEGMTFPRDYPKIIVNDGYKIDLGNRVIEVIIAANHTPGGTLYLDRKSRILFSGDEILGNNEPLSISVAQFAANMRKLEAHRSEFDQAWGGTGMHNGTDIEKFLKAAELVLSGKEGEVAAGGPGAGGQGAGGPGGGGPGGAGGGQYVPRGFAPGPAPAPGQTVYFRHAVRAPDRPPGGGPGQPNPNRRVMTVEDRAITYDNTHIQN
jgi:glyoxylase-like metal-dependent hydrolase (beta-lactamase superfamily II)